MAGEDTDFIGEAFPADGISVGFLPQEPRLDAIKNVRGNVEEAVADIRALLTRYDEINAKFAEEMSPEDMDKILEEQAKVQDRIEAANALGSRFAPRARDGRPPAAAGRRRRLAPCPAASAAASRSAGCCSSRRICCCWTSRPIISTPSPSPGWSGS